VERSLSRLGKIGDLILTITCLFQGVPAYKPEPVRLIRRGEESVKSAVRR
jgi:hypothetical protein